VLDSGVKSIDKYSRYFNLLDRQSVASVRIVLMYIYLFVFVLHMQRNNN
jgi:hypothetical protein